MANIFGILTAIVLALSAFIALKNKAAYEGRITETATQKDNLTKSQARLKTAQDSLSEVADKTLVEVEAAIVTLTGEAATVKKTNDDLKLQIETKTAKVNSNKEQLDDVRDRTAQVGDLKELADKMREASAGREETAQSITDTEAKLANLTAQNSQAEGQANSIRAKLDGVSTGQSLPTLNTRIRSIYPSWGFVTLAAGNNGGVIANTTLNVVRGGEVIAQLLVTAVERNSASASIVPDSVAPNVSLMVGDRVVAAQKAEKQPDRN
ncbi:MAG: hypothetical protein EHM17_01325 [Verrucomicrobiaceae bacterium]|nr:MAG: hypothetical protein EHM17_15015 [Verrucomicrobiaceae bacterium]RPJ35768.1 MAG: hypothetical protein EHM17_01325 [Verrucomicrobiaceae bacterium]